MSVVYSFTGIFIGLFAIVAWWFAMFSDSDWGDLAREMLSESFSLGRNTIAVIEPAVGGFMLFGGCGLLTDATGGEDSFLSELFFIGCLVSLVVAVLGLVPVRLPGWMYPEWHEERRWRRREQAEWEAKYGSDDEAG
jgi:hypothetical protein